jgi:hypothetical protein
MPKGLISQYAICNSKDRIERKLSNKEGGIKWIK